MTNNVATQEKRLSRKARTPFTAWSALAMLLAHIALPACRAAAQQADAGALPQTASLLSPTLSELRSTISLLHIAKWKAPGPVKEDASGNVGSINRDLEETLPALVAQADSTPRSVANAFSVYRNLDALYEVLLRVSGTAELAAPDEEAGMITHSLKTLDAARRSLADSILSASRVQEAALTAPKPAPAPPPQPPPPTAVVSDGPIAATPAHRKAKPKTKTPATNPGSPQP